MHCPYLFLFTSLIMKLFKNMTRVFWPSCLLTSMAAAAVFACRFILEQATFQGLKFHYKRLSREEFIHLIYDFIQVYDTKRWPLCYYLNPWIVFRTGLGYERLSFYCFSLIKLSLSCWLNKKKQKTQNSNTITDYETQKSHNSSNHFQVYLCKFHGLRVINSDAWLSRWGGRLLKEPLVVAVRVESEKA